MLHPNHHIEVQRGFDPIMEIENQTGTPRDIGELVNHLKELTTELTAVHNELYWLAMQTQDARGQNTPADLNVNLLAELKGAVDNMRLLLWKYIETASVLDPEMVREGLEAQRLRRVTEFLQLLRDRLGHMPDEQPQSFIERISAAVREKIKDPRAA
ncbi:MAG TPA: hypothetical protein VN669_08165 [Candidatus Acidoferrales bacterium]|jgi:hypothetical protein|nr:hypothetical protein [Candidatus Acidoferrales bacterium]